MRGLATLFILASALAVSQADSQEVTKLKGPKGVDYGVEGRSIGPIRSTDTLWRIAAKVRPDNSVTIYQVMQALYEKNPGSFLDNNLNHMRVGAYLKIPSLAEIKTLDANLAREKSEHDDELWEKKKKGTLSQESIDLVQKQVTQARKADVEQARDELKQEITQIKKQQDSQLVELQQQFKSSVDNVEEILAENNQLKKQLNNISHELTSVRSQLDEDAQFQAELKALIDKQNRLLEEQRLAALQKEEEMSFELPTSVKLALMILLPSGAFLAGLIMWLRRRKSAQSDAGSDDDFMPKAPAAPTPNFTPPEESFDITPEDDMLDGGLDASIQLDDSLDEDFLPDNDDIMFDEPLDEGDSLDSILDDEELDGLLSDDIVFDDESNEQDTELPDTQTDDFLQQDFDVGADDISVEIPEESEPGSDTDILSESDLDALFDSPLDEGDELEPDIDTSDDALAALSEEMAEENLEQSDDELDIDALIDEADIAEDEDASSADEDEIDLDALMDEAALEAEEPEAIDMPEEEGDIDIDALMDEAAVEAEEPEAVDMPEEEGDIDIDALMDEATLEAEEPAAIDMPEEEGDIDIDALMDEAAVEAEEPEAFDMPEEEGDIDIDALMDEAAVEAEEPEAFDVPEEGDIDIDALMDEAALEAEEPEAVDMPEEESDIDIDALMDEAALEAEGPAAIDMPEEEGDIDIDALMDEATLEAEEPEAIDMPEEEGEIDIDELMDEATLEAEESGAIEEPQVADAEELAREAQAMVDEKAAFEEESDLREDTELVSEEALESGPNELLDEPQRPAEENEDSSREEMELVHQADDSSEDTTQQDVIEQIDELLDDVEMLDNAELDTASQPAHLPLEAIDESDDLTSLGEDIAEPEEPVDTQHMLEDMSDDDLDSLTEELSVEEEPIELSQQEPQSELNDDMSLEEAEPAASEQLEEEAFSEHIDSARIDDEIEMEELEQKLGHEAGDEEELHDFELGDEVDLDELAIQAADDSRDMSLEEAPELELDDSEEEITAPDWSLEETQDTGEIELGDDPLADDVDLEQMEEQIEDTRAQADVESPSRELDEYPELSLEESDEVEEADDNDLLPSGAEQQLAEAMQQTMPNDDILDDDLGMFGEDEAATSEDELPASEELEASDDTLDSDFINELTQTDFDALLNELAEPDEFNEEDEQEFEVDFDNLLKDEGAEPIEVDESETPATLPDDEFVDIETLIDESEEEGDGSEPYDEVNMDVGLDEFDELMANEQMDVDTQDNGYSAKLDLARAYIEIDDREAALEAIREVIENGPPEVQQEASQLLAKLES